MHTSLLLIALAALVAMGCTASDETGDPGQPDFGVPQNEWTFVPIDGATCGNGSDTGFALNPTSASKRLMIHLQGGGACYNEDNCTGPDAAASHFDGYDESDLAEWAAKRGLTGNFDRDDEDNPFQDYSYAFVPYCTGDVHVGNRIDDGLHFVGQANLKLYLAKIVDTYPNLEEVVLVGTSAGGFGTMLNFWLVADAFPGVAAHFVDDSGPLMPLSVMLSLQFVIKTWGLQETIAPGCDECLDGTDPDGGPHRLITYYAKNYPKARISLVSSMRDKTIVERFLVTEENVEAALNDIADKTGPTNPNFRVFYLAGDHHGWLDGDEDTDKLVDVQSEGSNLASFIKQQLSGDAEWNNVRPK